ncbi:Uncharacterised protein [Mycobacterium tuberculosis]|nr:Uncharacterised protein [Mycobacterium tuberculosis]
MPCSTKNGGASADTWLIGEASMNGCGLAEGRCLTIDFTSSPGIMGCMSSKRVKS